MIKKFKKGRPPHKGWWLTRLTINGIPHEGWRWFKGNGWSSVLQESATKEEAGVAASFGNYIDFGIEWSDYWPLFAPFNRADPDNENTWYFDGRSYHIHIMPEYSDMLYKETRTIFYVKTLTINPEDL